MASHSERMLQYCARNVPKLPKTSLFEPKEKVKESDSDLKKKEKEKDKLLPSRFGN